MHEKKKEDQTICRLTPERILRLLVEYVIKIEKAVKQLTKQGAIMAKTIEDLKASVARNTSASKSVLDVLRGIVEKFKECQTLHDFEAVTAELDANTKDLADAALENTPAEPPA